MSSDIQKAKKNLHSGEIYEDIENSVRAIHVCDDSVSNINSGNVDSEILGEEQPAPVNGKKTPAVNDQKEQNVHDYSSSNINLGHVDHAPVNGNKKRAIDVKRGNFVNLYARKRKKGLQEGKK